MNDQHKRAAKLFETQIAFTEWLASIDHEKTVRIREENNVKTERLRAVNEIIEMPFSDTTQFLATELSIENPNFTEFLKNNGDKLCAIRLLALDEDLPTLRMRGLSVRDAYENWFKKQDIDPTKYRACFYGHQKQTNWSTIIVVNRHGIFGEIIRGQHYQLTQDVIDDEKGTRTFHYDFKTWKISPKDNVALERIKNYVKYLHVADADKREKMNKELGATFSHNYLNGYFETVDTDEAGLLFIDYSPSLGEMYGDFAITLGDDYDNENIKGRGASAGVARGEVKIVKSPNDEFPDGAVLVCNRTSPELVGFMKKACAIVTDQGGILSHAAIIARELGKPCVVGVRGGVTTILRDGQVVEVDGAKGTVKLFSC